MTMQQLLSTREYLGYIASLLPVGWWRFNESSGNILDYSGNGLHLTPTVGLAYKQANLTPAVRDGNSVNIGNTTACFIADNALLSFLSALTLVIWIKRPDTVASTYGLITKGNLSGGTTNLSYALFLDGTNGVTFRASNNGSTISAVATPVNALNDTNVHMIAVTCQPGQIRIYVDGVLRNWTSAAPASIFDSTATFRVGAGDTNADAATVPFTNGLIQEAAVWDSALSGGTIQRIFTLGNPIVRTPYNRALITNRPAFTMNRQPEYTLVADSFNRPDANTLGTSSRGHVWNDGGSFGISGNRCAPLVSSLIVASMDLTPPATYVQCECLRVSSVVGIVGFGHRASSSGGNILVQRSSDGFSVASFAFPAGWGGWSAGNARVIGMKLEGTTIHVYGGLVGAPITWLGSITGLVIPNRTIGIVNNGSASNRYENFIAW